MKTSAYLVYNTTTGRSYAGTRNAQGRIITRWENPKASLAKVKADAKKRNTRRIYTQSNWKKVADNGVEQTFEAILKKN